jgi:hypothetical protein
MKNLIIIIALLFNINTVSSQEMNNEKLNEIFISLSDTIQGDNGRWQFVVNDVVFVCLTDVEHNRMRIISPITESNKLDEDQKTLSLLANFHTALDVKYALSDDVLWSVFIHPLKELTTEQVENAISQVYYANLNFGTSYSSTDLVFPGKENKEAKLIKKKTFKKKT